MHLQGNVEDKMDGQDSIALSPTAHEMKHRFHRPPLDGVGSAGIQSGNLPQWTGKIRSLLDLVDFNAFYNPDLLFGLQESKASAELRSITYKDLAQAVGRCIGWLVNQNLNHISNKSHGQSQAKPPPVALLMNSDVNTFIYVLALMRLGIPVALFSARLSPSAIAHLIDKIEVKSMIITSHTARSAKAATDDVQKKGHGAVTCINSASFETFIDGDQAMYDNVPSNLPAVDELDRDVIILHSSGSTGLPKPIYHTHGYLLNYAKCHKFEPEEDTSKVCTSTLPLFHGFGMLAPALALSIGKPLALPSASSVPNAESTIRLLQAAKSTSLMTVPLILEDLCYAADEAGIKALQPLNFVACGGGPMKTAVAEILSSRGVRLLNHCGATEIGALAPIFNPQPDYDWHYFVIRNDIGLRLESVLERPGCVKLIGRAPGWDEDFVVQDFLQPNPNAPTSQFQFLGRADDLIVLANGEKIRCTSLEANVANDPRVTDAIAFGEGRNHIGLIIEVAPDVQLDCSNREKISSFREEIWPTVEDGNKDTDSHGTISKDMIIVTTSSHRPLPRTAKGSLARKEIFDLFAEEIDASYAEAEIADVGPLPDINNMPALENYIRSAVIKILGLLDEDTNYSVDDDLFEMGMNSLQATKLHNILQVALDKKLKTQSDEYLLSKGFVYSHPTVATQCEALAAILLNRHGSFRVKESSRTEPMNEAVDRHVKAIADMNVTSTKLKPEKIGKVDGKIVIITGSTGNLGSTLVFNLAQDPSISHIYCLNRPSSSESSQMDRQHRAFNKAGICLSPHLWSKLHPLVAKPQEPNFGLGADIYSQLQGASHIIHNAWPMDFNRSLVSFEAQLHYLDGIIKLALQSTSSTPPRILFTSSIAAVARHPLRTHKTLVPEVPMDDPDVTAPFGYPEAKWVCEQILLKSAQLHPSSLEPVIVRIGQLTGSRTAASWASTEHLPSVFRSSLYLGALPDIQGTLSWLPLDTAASSLLQILFQPSSSPTSQVYHLENPCRQSWSEMLALLSKLLVPSPSPTPTSASTSHPTTTSPLPIIPFPKWLSLVSTDPDPEHNPAVRLLDFLEGSFQQLGTGDLVLDTERAREVSEVLARTEGVEKGLVQAYVRFWRAEWGV